MKGRRISKKAMFLLLIILIVVLALVGVAYTFAASSSDITAPVTTSTVTGTKEAAPFTDFYKDSATVTLAATDPAGVGGGTGGGSAQTLDIIGGTSPSATFAAGAPASTQTTPLTENFSNFDNKSNPNWDVMPAQNGAGNVGSNGDVLSIQVNVGGFASGIRTRGYADLSNSPQPVVAEVQTTVRSIGSAITFNIEQSQNGNPNESPASMGFRIYNSSYGFEIGFQATPNSTPSGQMPQGQVFDDLTLPAGLGWTDIVNHTFKWKIIYDNSLHTVQGKVDLNNNGIYDEPNIDVSTQVFPFTWSQPQTQISMWSQSISDMFTPNPTESSSEWDNLTTNILMTIPASPDGFNLSGVGMSLGGTTYMDSLPKMGINSGVIFWGQNGPESLPKLFPDTSNGGFVPDLYVYLMSVDLSNMIGQPTPPFKWTTYSNLDPAGFAQVITALNSGAFGAPLPTSVEAFALALKGPRSTGCSGSDFCAVSVPISSAGSIAYNAGTGQADILPPATSAPVISGVNKTYYRIGDTGSFVEYTAPINVNTSGANNVYYYSTDNAGNMETVQSILVKVDRDTDGDGVYDNYDSCPNVMSTYFNGCPSAIQVNAENWTLDSKDDKNHPKSSSAPLAGLPIKIYDYNTIKNDLQKSCKDNWKEEDDNGEEGDSEDCIKAIDYEAIVAKYTPLYTGTTDSKGEVKIAVYAKDSIKPALRYLVIGDYAGANLNNRSSVKLVKKVHVKENKTKKVKMRLETVKVSDNSKDDKCYATKKTTVNGSGNLDIIEPEYIDYVDTQEYYPIIFQSSDDFTAATAITPPDGWSADVAQIVREIPPGATDTAQFTLTNATVASSGSVRAAAVNDKKPEVSTGNINMDYQAKGGHKKNYKSEYQSKKKEKRSVKPVTIEAPKSFMDKLKEKGDKNTKITEEIRNKNVLQRVKGVIKRIL